MATLLVRGLDDDIVEALEERARLHGHDAEAEHRLILIQALAKPRRRYLAEVLMQVPNVGRDEDFERVQSDEPAPDVFD